MNIDFLNAKSKLTDILEYIESLHNDIYSRDKKLKKLIRNETQLELENERYREVINKLEEAYRSNQADIDEALDSYFYGGKSPVRDE